MMKYFRFIPLFLFLLLIYDAMILTGVKMNGDLFTLRLISGESWSSTWSDVLLVLGIIALYIELVKSTSSSMTTIIEHSLSVLVFIGFLVEFLVMKGTATSAFVILMLMSLLDVMAGFTITVSTARRDFMVEPGSR
ncbi:conserved membrane hypothetical protein [Gammaproteobacteria bacterium]